MGKATRWLKGLFDLNRNHHHNRDPKSSSDSGDKQRRSFGHSGRISGGLCQNPATIPPNITPAEAAWLRSFHTTSTSKSIAEEEKTNHAMAVAAATAAAADAAAVAAQAAAAVVRLTTHGRDAMLFTEGVRERRAAVRIQSVFRGYLARKAHRALKGLVRLQALVKGFLVRKQADATFHSMQALLRAQATVKLHKARATIANHDARFHSETRPRRSTERFDDASERGVHSKRLSVSLDSNSIDESPKIVEMDTGRPRSRSRRNINTCFSDFGDDSSSQSLSPLPFQIPAPIAVPGFLKWGDESRFFSTAQSTPRFSNSSNASPSKMRSPFPNYMAGTQSFKAKLRSYSAPKQRPKKNVSVNEMEIQMQRSSSAVSVKNAVTEKIERCLEFGRERNRRW